MPRPLYNRYHPALVCYYAFGKEHLVPEHVRKCIPHSTASGWRRLDSALLIGHEVWEAHQQAFEFQELLIRYEQLRNVVLMLVKVWLSVADIILPILRQKEHGERVVNAIQRLFTIMPRRSALRLAGFSHSAFHERLSRIKARCGISPAERCFQRHPLQLALGEVQLIKALYADAELALWPGVSLIMRVCAPVAYGWH